MEQGTGEEGDISTKRLIFPSMTIHACGYRFTQIMLCNPQDYDYVKRSFASGGRISGSLIARRKPGLVFYGFCCLSNLPSYFALPIHFSKMN
jgi:hypothetical protein